MKRKKNIFEPTERIHGWTKFNNGRKEEGKKRPKISFLFSCLLVFCVWIYFTHHLLSRVYRSMSIKNLSDDLQCATKEGDERSRISASSRRPQANYLLLSHLLIWWWCPLRERYPMKYHLEYYELSHNSQNSDIHGKRGGAKKVNVALPIANTDDRGRACVKRKIEIHSNENWLCN